MKSNNETQDKSKDEEILKLRKLAALFKNECKKLKEENDLLKRNITVNKQECDSDDKNNNKESSSIEGEDISRKLKQEFGKRMVIEKNYKKLKEFTFVLEEKLVNLKKENKDKCKNLEEKLNECYKNLNMCKYENENLKEKIKEKDVTVDKLNNKIDEFRIYLKGEKSIINNNLLDNITDDEVLKYKLEIKKLKENIEILKKNDEITSKERQQYKSMIVLCSQYKEKCKKIPLLESKIDILESKIKELEIFKYRDKERFENIKELKNSILNHQIENNKLTEQLNEWMKFSKLYINDKAINIENLKKSLNDIYNKYNQVNFTKTDLEVKYKKLSIDIEIEKQNSEDKNLELRILKNKIRFLEKKYELLKRDYLYELNKAKGVHDRGKGNSNTVQRNQGKAEKQGEGLNREACSESEMQLQRGGNEKDDGGDDSNTACADGDEDADANAKEAGSKNFESSKFGSTTFDSIKLEGANFEKLLTDYKTKYDMIKKDNQEKEKLIEELNENMKKYKSEYESFYLKQKNAEMFAEELQFHKKEIIYLKEEVENYKNKIVYLENDLTHVKNQWREDNEKNDTVIRDLKETIKKVQFDNKMNNKESKGNKALSTDLYNNNNSNNSVSSNHSHYCNKDDISVLYRDIESLKSMDEIELTNMRNEILYLKSKIEVIKIYYTSQIKSYREAFLYLLGWDVQVEHSNEEVFFILTSLFSTHDGKFIFIKSKCANEKRSYHPQNEGYRSLKKMKVELAAETDTHKFDDVKDGVGEQVESGVGNSIESGVGNSIESGVGNSIEAGIGNSIEAGIGNSIEAGIGNSIEAGIGNSIEAGIGNSIESGVGNSIEAGIVDRVEAEVDDESEVQKERERSGDQDKENFYDGLFNERNEINTNAVIEKSNLQNTNINISTIMKGCKYNLLLHGYYSIKWNENVEWKRYINKINTYPILLSLSCIEEYNNIKCQYNNNLSKNHKGMLFKI
ncbi:conserved Plasmodium protein, unknown function [Plasmodium malariae]|uniref:Uncharacterized protein n=1 Tax=Plasmodium malariae TaxID=5858 RepID=A0A1D3JID1_PLAMA|nr:conserved Plasmodium protein, unknown function [Plasmodium malariae]SBT86255.1 conserved Plasmodium protein, unknown function [Plasmodium malariae]